MADHGDYFRRVRSGGRSLSGNRADKDLGEVTVQEIGKEIASRAGIALAWDVEGTPFTIQSIEQSSQTDCDFYMQVCESYGYAMKVYAQKIVVFDREAYKKKGLC